MVATNLYAGIAANNDVKTVNGVEVTNYEQAAEFLGDASERQLAANTVLVRQDADTIAVRLYDTFIVAYYRYGKFSVHNGGFNTPTTSRRVNQFTPAGWNFYHENKQLTGRHNGQEYKNLTHWVHLDPA